ncbi:hypothetical protein [Acidobacterium sp. S8]|uniref:hypothetical protein n=1 Tax=Acidobacterium sp. S8 TaxID=1641854 RepID=UPI00131E8AEE|nr:hypothetical protein [Acidobacterium sp. S8]
MKREAPTNTKLKRLCWMLDLPLYVVVGILELLWHMTARERPRGDIGNNHSDEDIALGIDYRNDPTKLIEALVECRLLDRHPKYRLVVHDWNEHAEDSIDIKLARAVLTYASGHWPRMTRLNKNERKQLEPQFRDKYGSRPDAKMHEQIERAHDERTKAHETPLPSLALPCLTLPLPNQNQDTHAPLVRRNASSGDESAGADETHTSGDVSSVCVLSSQPLEQNTEGVFESIIQTWNNNCLPEFRQVKDTPTRRNFLRICIKRHKLTPAMMLEAVRYLKSTYGSGLTFDQLIQHDTIVKTLEKAAYRKAKPMPAFRDLTLAGRKPQ